MAKKDEKIAQFEITRNKSGLRNFGADKLNLKGRDREMFNMGAEYVFNVMLRKFETEIEKKPGHLPFVHLDLIAEMFDE